MKHIAALLVAGTLILVGCNVRQRHDVTLPANPATTVTHALNEDDPGWDCHTMGNHVCGPLTAAQTAAAADDRAVVSPPAGYACWAEANDAMPEGYEVLCKEVMPR